MYLVVRRMSVGLYVLLESFIFNMYTEQPGPSPRSGDPAKVYPTFRPRLNS